jgi:hypothetical protein
MTNIIKDISSVERASSGGQKGPRPRCSLGRALFALAGVVVSLMGREYFQARGRAPVRIEACNRFYCPEIDPAALRPYERLVDRKFLQLQSDNPIALWFGASEDHNTALSPQRQNFHQLTNGRQLKYSQIQEYDEICKEIDAAAELGPVDVAVVSFHGSQSGGDLSQTSRFSIFNPHRDCFKNMQETAQIVLLSCSTGDGENSIAEVVAKQSGRKVIAPIQPIPADALTINLDSKMEIRLIGDGSEDLARVFDSSSGPLSLDELKQIEEEHRSNSEYDEKILQLVGSSECYELERLLQSRQISRNALKEALMIAAEEGETKVLRVLLRQKNMTETSKGYAAASAAKKGETSALKLILSSGNPISEHTRGVALLDAADRGHDGCVHALLMDRGPVSDKHLSLGFICAAYAGHTRVARTMLNERKISDLVGNRAIYEAITNGKLAMVQLLIDQFPLSTEDVEGFIRHAERNGYDQIGKELRRVAMALSDK